MPSWGDVIDRALEWEPHPLLAAGLKHRSPVSLEISYPLIGLINRLFQVAILGFVLNNIFHGRTWAYSETPLGTVNAFGGPGDVDAVFADKTHDDILTAYPYCDNPSSTATCRTASSPPPSMNEAVVNSESILELEDTLCLKKGGVLRDR